MSQSAESMDVDVCGMGEEAERREDGEDESVIREFEVVQLQSAVLNARQVLSTARREVKAFRRLGKPFQLPRIQDDDSERQDSDDSDESAGGRLHFYEVRLRPGISRLDWTVAGQFRCSRGSMTVSQTFRVLVNRF
jgi:hypothetical protein